MAKSSSVVQLRVEEALKQAFADAAQRAHTTTSQAMRGLMEEFVRESRRREAERQSRIVAAASDYEETMADITRAGEWVHD